MQLLTFPDRPAFEQLLSGCRTVDLLAVLAEVGDCDLERLEQWAWQVSTGIRSESLAGEQDRLMALATDAAALRVDHSADGRVCHAARYGVGWSLPVALLEQRVLAFVGIHADVLSVFGEILLRVESAQSPFYHPVGCQSVWVEQDVAAGFLSARLGSDTESVVDSMRTVERSPVPAIRESVRDYLECWAGSFDTGRDSGEVAIVRRKLAALEPDDAMRWVDLAEAELAAGRPAAAFDLSARLEKSGVSSASDVRARCEHALASRN